MLYCVCRDASASRSLLRADSSDDVDELDDELECGAPSATEKADDDELDAPQRRGRRASPPAPRSTTRGSDAATHAILATARHRWSDQGAPRVA